MNDESTPWWFSAADGENDEAAGASGGSEPGTEGRAVDIWALLGSVQRLAGWAQQLTAEQVLAPHAEHADPAAHPTCILCRTTTMLSDVRGFAGAGMTGADSAPFSGDSSGDSRSGTPSGISADPDQAIVWLEVHRGPCKR